MKKKTPVASQHPAAASAESDLIKLTREFESLRAQLKANDDAINEHQQSIEASHINYTMSVNFNQKKIAQLQRIRRNLEAQFTNVSELLTPLIEARNL